MNKLTSRQMKLSETSSKRSKTSERQNQKETKTTKKKTIYRITYLSMESFTSFQNNLFVP